MLKNIWLSPFVWIAAFQLFASPHSEAQPKAKKKALARYHSADRLYPRLQSSARRNTDSTVFIAGFERKNKFLRTGSRISAGTGFFITGANKGHAYILTNQHVVKSASTLRLLTNRLDLGNQGDWLDATAILMSDEGAPLRELDYAVVKVPIPTGADDPHFARLKHASTDAPESFYSIEATTDPSFAIRTWQSSDSLARQAKRSERHHPALYKASVRVESRLTKRRLRRMLDRTRPAVTRTILPNGYFHSLLSQSVDHEKRGADSRPLILEKVFNAQNLSNLSDDFELALASESDQSTLFLDMHGRHGASGSLIADSQSGDVFGLLKLTAVERLNFGEGEPFSIFNIRTREGAGFSWVGATPSATILEDLKKKRAAGDLDAEQREAVDSIFTAQGI